MTLPFWSPEARVLLGVTVFVIVLLVLVVRIMSSWERRALRRWEDEEIARQCALVRQQHRERQERLAEWERGRSR